MSTPGSRIIGVFDMRADAEQARAALMAKGVTADISVDHFAVDPIAAEMPGQSYQNQPGQGGDDKGPDGILGSLLGTTQKRQREQLERGDAVRSGSCTVSIDATASMSDKEVIALLNAHGARRIN